MANEQFTTQPETFRRESEPSTNQRLSYATQRAEVLFGCYRRGDANDPDRYVTAIAAVLTLYDFELMREVTDPRTGIQTTEAFMTFMPQSGELKRYCDDVAARKHRMEELAKIPRLIPADRRLAAPAAGPGAWANVFVPAGHRRYERLVVWSQTADERKFRFGKSSDGRDGIWITHNVWDVEPKKTEQWRSWTADELLARYAKAAAASDEQVPFE